MQYNLFYLFSDNASSLAMADLMHSSLRENNLKRLFYVPCLLIVDCLGQKRIGSEDRKSFIKRLVEKALHFTFDLYVTSMEDPGNIQHVENTDNAFEYLVPSEESTNRLCQSFNSIKDNTAREDLEECLLANTLASTAKTLGCQKVFVPDSATSLAIKLMTGKKLICTPNVMPFIITIFFGIFPNL